jgi:hypothetical protein
LAARVAPEVEKNMTHVSHASHLAVSPFAQWKPPQLKHSTRGSTRIQSTVSASARRAPQPCSLIVMPPRRCARWSAWCRLTGRVPRPLRQGQFAPSAKGSQCCLIGRLRHCRLTPTAEQPRPLPWSPPPPPRWRAAPLHTRLLATLLPRLRPPGARRAPPRARRRRRHWRGPWRTGAPPQPSAPERAGGAHGRGG